MFLLLLRFGLAFSLSLDVGDCLELDPDLTDDVTEFAELGETLEELLLLLVNLVGDLGGLAGDTFPLSLVGDDLAGVEEALLASDETLVLDARLDARSDSAVLACEGVFLNESKELADLEESLEAAIGKGD